MGKRLFYDRVLWCDHSDEKKNSAKKNAGNNIKFQLPESLGDYKYFFDESLYPTSFLQSENPSLPCRVMVWPFEFRLISS